MASGQGLEEQYLALHDAVELRGEMWKVPAHACAMRRLLSAHEMLLSSALGDAATAHAATQSADTGVCAAPSPMLTQDRCHRRC
eukprot:1321083-Rhodomonas_salina.1